MASAADLRNVRREVVYDEVKEMTIPMTNVVRLTLLIMYLIKSQQNRLYILLV